MYLTPPTVIRESFPLPIIKRPFKESQAAQSVSSHTEPCFSCLVVRGHFHELVLVLLLQALYLPDTDA